MRRRGSCVSASGQGFARTARGLKPPLTGTTSAADWVISGSQSSAGVLMRTGNSSGSTSGARAALSIVNTGSTRSNAVVLTELKTVMPTQVEGPNIIYELEPPNGTCATGLFHLECVFRK
jgi:hypothetical protein